MIVLSALLLPFPSVPDRSVDALARCLAITDPQLRLPCLDREAHALVDEGPAPSPTSPSAADHRRPMAIIEALESTLKAAVALGGDRWTLVLADDSRWQTTEAWLVTRTLKPGIPVSLRRVALGGYVLRLAGERSTRVRRIG